MNIASTNYSKFLKRLIILSLVVGAVLTMAVNLVPPALASGDNVSQGEPGSGTDIPDPLGYVTPSELAGRIIRAILGISGAAALVIFIYGGIMFMFSGGNPNRVQTAKNTLVYAALGLAIIFASYAILKFVLEAIVKATGSS